MISQRDDSDSTLLVEVSNLAVYIVALPEAEVEAPLRAQAESAAPSIRRHDAWRHERVANAAYHLAANRGFEPGHEAQDWSLAELQIDARDEGRAF